MRHIAPIPVDLRIATYSGPFVRPPIRWSCLRPCGLQLGVWTCMLCPKRCHVYHPLHGGV